MNPHKYRTLLCGCGRMGASQANLLAKNSDFALGGVQDIHAPSAESLGAAHEVPSFVDLTTALQTIQPEVVVICSHNTSHAPLTMAALDFGVKAVYCEKPMAIHLGDARRMVQRARETGAVLAINHQRRLLPDLLAMRDCLASGQLGRVRWIRTHNQGDLLTDGTHAIDSLLFLLEDQRPLWVMGQFHRDYEALTRPNQHGQVSAPEGKRYGHAVESGAMAIIGFPQGVRAECFFGDLVPPGAAYQDYWVEGEHGRIWRPGDFQDQPNCFIEDGNPGTHRVAMDVWMYRPQPVAEGQVGTWRPLLHASGDFMDGIELGYRLLAASLRTGCEHPLSGEKALLGMELMMAIFESARLRRKIDLPLVQERHPLEIMLENPAAYGLDSSRIRTVSDA